MELERIKYRAKDKFTRRWVYGFPRKTALGNWFIHSEDATYPIIPETLGEYTGLKDKDYKEIYEGDIVKFYDDIEDELIIGKVCYDTNFCSFCVESKTREDVSLDAFWGFTIIGNIHDNKNLLEQ